jgi:RNA polymerase sigma-70 factor (family 1)
MDTHDILHPDDILQRLAAGEERAFREVYDRYWKIVCKAAMRYLRSPDLAGDVVQEVFCSLWDRHSQFLNVRNLESYLVTMTHHQVYTLFRKWATETRSREAYAENLASTVNDTDFSIRSSQYEEILTELVDKLPPQQKQVFKMAREEGMTHEAIARELNLSQGTVKNHMVRALQFLRQNLSPHVSLYLLLLAHT